MTLGLECTPRWTKIFTGLTAPPWLTRFPHGLQANQTIPTNNVLICTLTIITTEKENGIITSVLQSIMLLVRNLNKASASFLVMTEM